jgi:hypothetical protein
VTRSSASQSGSDMGRRLVKEQRPTVVVTSRRLTGSRRSKFGRHAGGGAGPMVG